MHKHCHHANICTSIARTHTQTCTSVGGLPFKIQKGSDELVHQGVDGHCFLLHELPTLLADTLSGQALFPFLWIDSHHESVFKE